jgi:hypothetical protein
MCSVIRLVLVLVSAILCVCLSPVLAFSQGGATSSISGVIVDTVGGVVPGASVVVKSNATGSAFEATTNSSGAFSVPAIDPGVYTVTITLAGFKTVVIKDVRVQPGVPATASATLELGALNESVFVASSSEIINTQTATVSSTLNVDQVNKMPMPSRNALNAVTFLPGVNTAGVNRDSTVNGLPESYINITLDGVSNNDNFNKSTDGFFANVTPRQDAIEAVTVTTAVGGADVGGHGAISINFATRSGTNTFSGSAYEYYRAPALNTNTWFNKRNNLPKNDVKLNQYGIRQGGPIVIPGLYDGRGKAFFFANYEELRLPNNFSRTRRVLHPRAQEGWYRYPVGGEIREVNVLALAAASGQLATADPTIMKTFGYINAAIPTTGVLNASTDPMVNNYVWQSPGNQTEKQPVVRIDYNLGSHHRLSGTWNRVWVVRDPDHLNNNDRRFPTSTNYGKFVSSRPSRSVTLRSTLGNNLVSELRGGFTRGGASYFGKPETNGPQTFEDTNGLALDFDPDENIELENWFVENGPTWRSAYQYSVDETLSWQKRSHSLTFGGSLFFGRAWEHAQQIVPEIDLGFNTTQDPANTMFTSGANGNFRDASASQLTDARQLYAILTGRVTAVTGQAALNPDTGTYSFLGQRRRAGKMNEYSLFVQDSWRATPALTINAGLRWDVQMPFSPVDDVMTTVTLADICGMSGLGNGGTYSKCNFYAPGATGGKHPEFSQFKKGNLGYDTDWNNIAPNIGVAWRPNVQSGWLRALLGDPDQATLRGGYSVAYERQGMGRFTGQFGPNPGSVLSLTRNVSTGLGQGSDAPWPVLLRQANRLYNAPFPETPSFPIQARPNRADSIEGFAPDIVIASARSWTVGFQRALSRDTAMEIRYVATRGVDQWSELNYNERNVIENGFFEEFKLAMANLKANNGSGIPSRAGSFAYFGQGSGTNPLPIYLAYLNGSRNANDPAAYTGGSNTWTNSTLAQRLVGTNPNLNSGTANAVIDLDGTLSRRQNALAAGLAPNFFVVNPAVNNVNVFDSGAFSDYHAVQLELRRRLSRGLQVNSSYQYAMEGGSAFLGFRYGRVMDPNASTVRHAFKTQWDWTLPVGRGRRFGANLNPILNGVLGGWQFNGVGRVQARMVDFGNVRLVGMTPKDVQKLYKHDIRIDPATGLRTVFTMPEDVILNTRRAFSVSTTTLDGYSTALGKPEGRYFAPANSADCIQLKAGDCAPRTLLVRAPFFSRFDIGVTKKFPIHGNVNFELRADVLNVFDNVNFNQSNSPGTGLGIFQVTSAYSDLNNVFDPGGRLGQLVFRLNW